MLKSFFIETYGCQMNKAESSALIKELEKKGFTYVENDQYADIVILNTCSVRKTAENRIWGRLGYFKALKKKKDIVLLIMGCMSQRIGDELINSNYGVDFVVGNFYKQKIPEILLNYRKGEKATFVDETNYTFSKSYPDELNPSKAYVTISHGCNNFCSYCIVPYLRGREISRESEDIINDIKNLVEQGVLQVTLLGQNVNSYGKDKKDIDFATLLKKIAKETDIKWIKFLSSHPKDLSDSLIDVIANEEKVSKWLHLALQSGSDRILKLMNRNYTSRDYLKIVEKLKKANENIILTTDIIVGFPTETEEDFKDTLKIVEEAGFSDAYMYKYNEIENTMAFKNFKDDIPDNVKIERLTKLIDFQREISLKKKKEFVGKILEVIPDSISKDNKIIGFSKEELPVVFNGVKDDFGNIINVYINELNGSTLVGKKL